MVVPKALVKSPHTTLLQSCGVAPRCPIGDEQMAKTEAKKADLEETRATQIQSTLQWIKLEESAPERLSWIPRLFQIHVGGKTVFC